MTIQTLGALGGVYCRLKKTPKLGKFFLDMSNIRTLPTHYVKKDIIPYAGGIYCVNIPSKYMLMRQNNAIIAVGP